MAPHRNCKMAAGLPGPRFSSLSSFRVLKTGAPPFPPTSSKRHRSSPVPATPSRVSSPSPGQRAKWTRSCSAGRFPGRAWKRF